MRLCNVAACCVAAQIVNAAGTWHLERGPPAAPSFGHSFEVEYNFSLPYEKTLQPDGLVYPVHVWHDADDGVTRMDTYSINTLITTKGEEVEVFPRLDKLQCARFQPEGIAKNGLGRSVLPDLSDWSYWGKDEVNGQPAYVYEYKQRHGPKETIYHFSVSKSGEPLRLHMHGQDLFSGSHFDEYQADYISFKPGRPDSSVFRAPEDCKDAPLQTRSRPSSFALQVETLLPSMRLSGGHAEYDEFAATFGRRHVSQEDYSSRVQTFLHNQAFINDWNAENEAGDGKRHTLELNKFADWSQEEFEAIMLPKKGTGRTDNTVNKHSHEIPYKPLADPAKVPTSVSWAGTGADGTVKDQASCGSCWAFGATAALQGAYFMGTGKTVAFAEQQLMDCSWGYGLNHACDGGDYDGAIENLVDIGGIFPDVSYEYLGQDAFCRVNKTSAERIQFEGYSYVPQGDNAALREALYSRGPIAVSIDAGQPSFRFYAQGIYQEPNCRWKEDELDHAVTLMGYGRSTHGQEFWLIKNSWSKWWGKEGFIWVAADTGRDKKACGITSDPLYAVYGKQE